MKVVVLTAIELEIADDLCPGCAAQAFGQGLSQVFEEGLVTIVDDSNCRCEGEERELHPVSAAIYGMSMPEPSEKTEMLH